MSFSLVDPGIMRPWIVCERSTRWMTSLHRFAGEIMPSNLVADPRAASRSQTLSLLLHAGPSIVLWEIDPQGLAAGWECLAQAAILAPDTLQIVAATNLSAKERLTLAALPISATIAHPEELVGLRPMVHRYFARSTQHLD